MARRVAIAAAAAPQAPDLSWPPSIAFGPMRLGTFSIIALVFLGLVVAGGAFLILWEPQAPVKRIERTIPDDKLPR